MRSFIEFAAGFILFSMTFFICLYGSMLLIGAVLNVLK
jgi:hypothetical protein